MAGKKKRFTTTEETDQRQKSIPKTTFEVEGKKYKFIRYQYINTSGKTITAEAALNDLAELERLVQIESGVISLAK